MAPTLKKIIIIAIFSFSKVYSVDDCPPSDSLATSMGATDTPGHTSNALSPLSSPRRKRANSRRRISGSLLPTFPTLDSTNGNDNEHLAPPSPPRQ